MNTTVHKAAQSPTNDGRFRMDPLLLGIYLLLVFCGMLAVYSASIAQAFEARQALAFFKSSGINLLLALAAFLLASIIPVRFWHRYSMLILMTGITLLALVLMPGVGVEINGSQRWINIAGWNFQPSEFAEFAFVVFAADYLTVSRHRIQRFALGVLPIVIVYLVFAGLLIVEPDFGSTVVLGMVFFALLYLNEACRRDLLLLCVAGLGAITALIVVEPYRMDRFMGFLDPFSDSYGGGFQLVQSLIAFGRGELWGVGLGNSVQKLFYLPYAGSDFLLAVIAEEWGFLGICAVVSMYAALVWRIFHIAWLAAATGDRFAMNLAMGIGLMIAAAAIINMGVNMGVLPTKGLTLPFLSDGGTSLIANSMAVGVVFSIQREVYFRTMAQ